MPIGTECAVVGIRKRPPRLPWALPLNDCVALTRNLRSVSNMFPHCMIQTPGFLESIAQHPTWGGGASQGAQSQP